MGTSTHAADGERGTGPRREGAHQQEALILAMILVSGAPQ